MIVDREYAWTVVDSDGCPLKLGLALTRGG
jgi:hypothetical protein